MKAERILKGVILSALVGLTTGCGQGFVGFSGTDPQLVIANQELELAKIQSETEAAEVAMTEAQAVIDGILVDGQIRIPESNSLNLNLGSISGIANKLRAVLDKVYNRLLGATAKAQGMITNARAQIAAAIAKLDPNDPRQAEMIAKLQQMLDRIDELSGRLGVIYDLLADQVNILVDKVDELIVRLDTGSILNTIIVNELKSVREVIVEFRDRLANT